MRIGDWEVNEEKIKGGLPALAERIHGLGLKFGLWVEPEMISEDSDLYREYPDWALKIPGRAMNRSRHQLNLDITRKEVRDHIMNQIFKVLDACKADYVKMGYEPQCRQRILRSTSKRTPGRGLSQICTCSI